MRKEGVGLSIFALVRRLRELRWGMVQNTEQYSFIYTFIGEYLKDQYKHLQMFQKSESKRAQLNHFTLLSPCSFGNIDSNQDITTQDVEPKPKDKDDNMSP